MQRFLLAILFVFLVVGCRSDSKLEKEIGQLPIEVDITRFDKVFAAASVDELPRLKQEFPMFFPKQYADSIWEKRFSDTLQQGLNREVARVFPSEEKLEEPLRSLFQHISYYFDDFDPPTVFTTTSDVDYQTKVLIADSLLIVELDTYLGSDHFYYEGISQYITATMRPAMIASDVATAYTRKYVAVPRERTLLAKMLYFGKELYLKDLWLPNTPDADKIGYTEEQLAWAQDNEIFIWSYFIENELLYSTDAKLPGRFINPAPFSKFQLELDNESPGMIGRYIGWQIVRSYMDKNEASLEELMAIPAEELFNKSKYKPKR